MVGLIATFLCALLIWLLFRLNREEEVRTSKALWIPTFWLFIAASRNVSAWLQFSSDSVSDQYLEGSPLDRAVLTVVLALGLIVLLRRSQRIGLLLRSNLPILLYFLYCGISVLWSDFPDVSFKRWIRALGDVVMVLIVLSDTEWLVPLRRLLTRIGFVLLPLSILFIRYFPLLGRSYTTGGSPAWTGVTTDKNALGMLSLLIGLASVFRFFQLRREKENTPRTGPLIAQGAMIVMSLYLLYEAHSATALACFFLAGVPMVLTFRFQWARRPVIVHVMVLAALGVAFSALFLNVGSGLVESLGRDTTLTGRTKIWHSAIGLVQNPFFGTGFENFWVGPRLTKMEELIDQGVNQAHNGYIEVFLNLGWVGIGLLTVLLIAAYLRIASAVRRGAPVASLRLAFFMVVIAYNFTEAGFKTMNPVWITFLLATMMIPEPSFAEYSPPLGVDHTDDLAERELEAARSYLQLKPGRHLAHRVPREGLQPARKL